MCRIEWRFLYLLPVWSRSYDFEDRVLDVGTVTSVHSVKAEGEGAAPLGCLVFLIPFPFNLLAGAFSKPPPEGKVIRIRFDSLATESQTDLIYFFNGAGTHEDVMALISGNELPPAFTSWSNQVLIWFVSDDQNHGQAANDDSG